MKSNLTRLRDRLSIASGRLARAGLVCGLLGGALGAVQAVPALAEPGGAIIIRSDRGGMIGQRSAEIRQLMSTGQRVELRGLCLSACTMYLSLPNACVSPSASFGFHGPTRNGRPLPQAEFEHWSGVMARHYREPLRSWYMSEARYRTSGYVALSGADLIRMGYRSC